MNKNFSGHLAVIGANIIFGINYVVAKGIMPDYLLPRPIIFLRVAGATLIFWLVSLFFPKEKIARNDMIRLAVCAVFGIAVNQILFFEGLNLSTPINAAVIMVTIPIMVLVFGHFIIGDKISRNKLLGILFGFSGAVYLILQGGMISLNTSTSLGNLLIFLNASSYALFLVLVKPLMAKYSPLTVMKWVFLFGFIYITPFTFPLLLASDFSSIPPNIWMSISYVVVFTTVLAYFLNNYSLKTISPTMNSAYIYLQPLLATVVALSVGKDKLTYIEVLAAASIFIGVYFVNFRKEKITG
ncbi:MAG: EamA/RhaT family transporter [Bacteroidetes bacterium]|nr:MAG: EamA/RhaT family transporter [Bacteroidota bacterium]